MQSILALVGAVGLQSGASQDESGVRGRMVQRIDAIVGGNVAELHGAQQAHQQHQRSVETEKRQEQEAAVAKLQRDVAAYVSRPAYLRYSVPPQFHPERDDPRPCVTLYPGSVITFEPILLSASGNRLPKGEQSWSISPKLPQRIGLTFNPATGVISGQVPLASSAPSRPAMGRDLSVAADDSLAGVPGRDSTPLSPSAATGQRAGGKHSVKDSIRSGFLSSRKPERADSNGALDVTAAQIAIQSADRGDSVRMARRTFVVIVRNAAGSAKTRVTFQVQLEPAVSVKSGKQRQQNHGPAERTASNTPAPAPIISPISVTQPPLSSST